MIVKPVNKLAISGSITQQATISSQGIVNRQTYGMINTHRQVWHCSIRELLYIALNKPNSSCDTFCCCNIKQSNLRRNF